MPPLTQRSPSGKVATHNNEVEVMPLTNPNNMPLITSEEIASSTVEQLLGKRCYYQLSPQGEWRRSRVTSIHKQDRLTVNAGFTCEIKHMRWDGE